MFYFRGLDNCFPINSRVMTNSIAESLVRKDYPSKLEQIIEFTPYTFRTLIPHVNVPDLPCLMLVRHPRERFLSALRFNNGDVKTVIEGLINETDFPNKDHFRRQTEYVDDCIKAGQDLTCFRYPDQVHLFQEAAGFITPFVALNESKWDIDELTDDEEEFIETYFADDLELFNSI